MRGALRRWRDDPWDAMALAVTVAIVLLWVVAVRHFLIGGVALALACGNLSGNLGRRRARRRAAGDRRPRRTKPPGT